MAEHTPVPGGREGSLAAPTRHPIAWRDPDFFDEESLFKELERVYDLCHGCRRCFSLCNSFPLLFDAIDESPTSELDGVDKKVYWEVVDHCYLCDMCYMTKCPYVPPHPWNIDFPHLMLRAKAVKFRKGETRMRDKVLSSTDLVGSIAGIPVISQVVNAVNGSALGRRVLDKVLGVHPDALLPRYESRTLAKRIGAHKSVLEAAPTEETRGKVALFTTCYGNYNEPHIADGSGRGVRAQRHSRQLVEQDSRCCGMPKLELGRSCSRERNTKSNIARMKRASTRSGTSSRPMPFLRADVQAGAAVDVPGRCLT
jgi:glycerol-3-phosphate dehydrogenase subunit C